MIREELKRGIVSENPIFGAALGLCPALAITTSSVNGLGMGLAFIFVLTGSNAAVSLTKFWIPEKVRFTCHITIIATFVTMADVLMKAYAPALNYHLGIYVPLLAANCIIIDRAEAYASKKNAFTSALDGIAVGLGFTVSLVAIAAIREFLGSNQLFGLTVIAGFRPMALFIMAPGGFFTLAAIIAIVNFRRLHKEKSAA